MKKVTIKDVAREAGVSVSIASYALNNVQGRVSSEVRQRVLEQAGKLGYVPNTFAKGLRRQSPDTIALVYDESFLLERNASTLGFVSGAVKYAGEKRKDILIKLAGHDSDWKQLVGSYCELWDSGRVEGIIFIHSVPDYSLLEPLKARDVNFVVLPPARLNHDFNAVYIDDYALMREGVFFIHAKGFEEVYYLTMKSEVPSDREAGYCSAVKALGLEGRSLYYESRFRGKGEVWEAIREVVEKKGKRKAICCWNDVDAIHVIDTLHARGIRIPEEIGVMGFDDIPGSEHTYPPLTTIRQPFEEMAREAVDLILSNADKMHAPGSIEVKGEIVERKSI